MPYYRRYARTKRDGRRIEWQESLDAVNFEKQTGILIQMCGGKYCKTCRSEVPQCYHVDNNHGPTYWIKDDPLRVKDIKVQEVAQ